MKKLLFAVLLFPVALWSQVQVAPFLSPNQQFFDNSGSVLAGGKVCTFQAGTTTPLTSYSDSAGTVPNQNPVILDSTGHATVFLQSAAYKIVVGASTANSLCQPELWHADNVTWNNLAQTLTSLTVTGTMSVQTSAAATSGANQGSPLEKLCGNYWTGVASAQDCWTWQDVLGTGSNPTSTLTASHSGSSGAVAMDLSNISAVKLPTSTIPNINGRILVDGVKYAASASGINQAITDAQANGSREIWLPCGTASISSTINITHGGFRFIGCGGGLTDAGSTPATMLQWTGAAGADMISILGAAAPNRIDAVAFENMILDGNGTARYVMRSEKVDDAILNNVRIRNGATAGFYAVDATGWKFRGAQFSQCSSYCAVFDWGTGGFSWNGGNVDILNVNTNPAILIQGAVNSWHANGVEFDASQTGAFVGYVQATAFDSNSSQPSAPTGGAGAPVQVSIDNSSFFQHASANAPSQGADILVSGTATNPVQDFSCNNCYFNGLSISPAAIKVDRGNGALLNHVTSKAHTTSTLITTANTVTAALWMVPTNNTDAANCTGAACGTTALLQVDSANGRLASIGGYDCTSAAGCQLGSAAIPFSDGFFGNAANQAVHFDVSAITAVRQPKFPDNTGQIAELNFAQTFSAAQVFSADTTLKRFLVTGSAPTCSVTGAGTGATCSIGTNATDSLGSMNLNTGTTPSSSGTVTLTFSSTFGSNAANCAANLTNNLANWNARATLIGGAGSTSSVTWSWDNNSVNLTGSTSAAYTVSYICGAR